jgi:hypothetical protein
VKHQLRTGVGECDTALRKEKRRDGEQRWGLTMKMRVA